MPHIGAADWIVIGVTLVVSLLSVAIHYESLALLNRWVIRQSRSLRPDRLHRMIILIVVLSLLLIHVVEIWLFGVAYFTLLRFETLGSLSGYDSFDLFDYIYFSASTYTTVGYGDLFADGPIRFLAGTESLLGFMLVTWSASFTYLVMARIWGSGRDVG
ncbi:MAG: ion channel [Pseudomonadota bacterium]